MVRQNSCAIIAARERPRLQPGPSTGHGEDDTMASIPQSTTQEPPTVIRTLRVRLYPGTAANGRYLEQLAGACRFAWNHVLAGHETDYRTWKAAGKPGEGPGSPTFFTLGRRFTQLRNASGHEWLQDYSYEIVRYACKYLGDAYAAFLDPDRPDHGRPQYKARHYTKPVFTLPSRVRIEDGSLYIPKRGWMRLGPIHRYADGKPLTVRCRQGSEGKQPKWYACIVFEVPVDYPDVCPPAADGAVGVDRNVGQATDSTGEVHALPDTTVEDAKIKRYQRKMARQQKGTHRRRRAGGKLRKLQHRKARRRDNATHQISRQVADTAHTVVLEDLNTKAMTKSAKGTVEKPGRNVKQKAGLNRAILASGWGQLERKLGSRTRPASCGLSILPTLRRPAANAGTPPSQTDRRRRCSRAGPAGSGRTPTTMRRSTSWCGRDFRPCPFRPAGLGLLHGEERSLPGRPQGRPKGLPRPVNRICVVSHRI